jgi:hypothetical protein
MCLGSHHEEATYFMGRTVYAITDEEYNRYAVPDRMEHVQPYVDASVSCRFIDKRNKV